MPDVYRHLHGIRKEHSWFSNAGNGFRIDHFMVSLEAEVTHQLDDSLSCGFGCFGAGNLVDVEAGIP